MFATVMASEVPAAPPSPTSQNVRRAVERSLPYVEKIGTAWMQERKCNSCHTVTFLVWTHSEAAARGFDIDRTKLAEWTKWSLADSLSDRFWFKLRPEAMAALKAGGLPEALLAKLKPLEGKTYTTREEYLHGLDEAIGHENLAANKERLLKVATLPNNGGGPDTLGQLLLGQAGSSEATRKDKGEDESYAAIRSLLLEWQEPDGSWQAQGQLPGLKWAGTQEMHQATTMWSLLAVSAGNRKEETLVRSRERALESLKKVTPGATIQTLALQLVIAHKFGEPARREALLNELIARQNADGGWGWVRENKGSDAFASGQALYALGLLGRDGKDPVVSRAWEFLLRTQDKDGSWQVPQEAINTRRRGLNVYTFWGTAWATIGMLQTLPAAEDKSPLPPAAVKPDVPAFIAGSFWDSPRVQAIFDRALVEKEAKKQQEDWAAKLKLPVEATNKIGMKLILIPPAGAALPKPYYLGKYEVTQREWEQVMGYNPSQFGPKDEKVARMDTSMFPVERVSWFDSVEFCNKLSEREGLQPYYELTVTQRGGEDGRQIDAADVKILGGSGYHIPTGVEWEHGCRAGTKTKYHCGDKDEDLLEYAWFRDNSDGRTHAVGEKKPNAFGLHDMHGNVREWNEEMLSNPTTGAPERVTRGGNATNPAATSAVSHRTRYGPASRTKQSYGLRLARLQP